MIGNAREDVGKPCLRIDIVDFRNTAYNNGPFQPAARSG